MVEGSSKTAAGQGNFFPAHAGLITAALVGSFDASAGDFAILAQLGQSMQSMPNYRERCWDTPTAWTKLCTISYDPTFSHCR